jgi:hypothetical protein
MFVLGMIGEYIGRLYVESKRRPLYLVADIAGPLQGRATLGYRAEANPALPAETASPPDVSDPIGMAGQIPVRRAVPVPASTDPREQPASVRGTVDPGTSPE